uniref:Transcriptional regulator n=1 Tax=Caenorhabditis tropicalis TaxID=1561998 RepID=A0A1I7URR3_9PELO
MSDVVYLPTRTYYKNDGLSHQTLIEELSKGAADQKAKTEKHLVDLLFDTALDSLIQQMEEDSIHNSLHHK